MIDVAHEALELRREAEVGPIGKRRSSHQLYALLRKCYWLARMCEWDQERTEAIRQLVTQKPLNGRNRTFVERGSSVYLLVARFVFHHEGASADRSNSSRYGKAMEEAARRDMTPRALEGFLREHGGINGLEKARPDANRSRSQKTLYLDRAIDVGGAGDVTTVTLRRRHDGQFEVMAHHCRHIGEPHVDPSQEEDPRDLREGLRSAGDVQSPAPDGRADGQAPADADHGSEGIAPGGAAVHPRSQL